MFQEVLLSLSCHHSQMYVSGGIGSISASGLAAAGSCRVESKKEVCELGQREKHEPSSAVFEITGMHQG